MSIWPSNRYLVNPAICLTLLRLFSSVTIIPLLIIYYWSVSPEYTISISLFFFGIALTDFCDGFVARLLHCETTLGAILDLISDKILITISLLLLAWSGKLSLLWALLFIIRELIVMVCRFYYPQYARQIGVIRVAKFKAALQMAYITSALLNHPFYSLSSRYSMYIAQLEWLLFVGAFAVTWYTGFIYIQRFVYLISRHSIK